GRVRVDPEGDRLARPDAPDVGFVDVRVDLHLGQVRGDDEERRRLHAGRDRLPDVHVALDDDAVDRGGDDAVLQVDLVLVDAGRGLRDLRHRRFERRVGRVDRNLRGVEIALRDQAARGELPGARVFLLRVGELHLVVLDVG